MRTQRLTSATCCALMLADTPGGANSVAVLAAASGRMLLLPVGTYVQMHTHTHVSATASTVSRTWYNERRNAALDSVLYVCVYVCTRRKAQRSTYGS
jgi:uncharacterized membrane protein AbrB (regulator of aidB expression)